MIKTISYETIHEGHSLCVMGAVHGNEKCGTIAINKIIQELENGDIKLKKGSLHLMPIANPKAYQENVRFIERNLNRHLYKKVIKKDYEDYLDPIICDFIDKGDFLLDLHSYASQTDTKEEAFIFISGNDKKEIDYAQNIGVKNFIYGWQQAFNNAENNEGNEKDNRESQGTTEYARLQNITAVTLECGQHLSLTAPHKAYEAIVKSLIYFDMLDESSSVYAQFSYENLIQNNIHSQNENNVLCIHMQNVFYKENEGDKLSKPWKHFEAVAKNQILAYRYDGLEIKAKENGYILLPKLNADNGGEWFYFGIQDSFESIQ